jgi:hypothetical protein
MKRSFPAAVRAPSSDPNSAAASSRFMKKMSVSSTIRRTSVDPESTPRM